MTDYEIAVPFKLSEVSGGAIDVMDEFLATRPRANMSVELAGMAIRNIAEKRSKAFIEAHIRPIIQDAFDMQVVLYGKYDETWERSKKDEWTDDMDSALEKALAVYQSCVSASWMGTNVIDSRLHEIPPSGPDEITKAARSFAEDAWRVLLHIGDAEDGEPRVKSTWQILSAVGIVQADVATILGQIADNPSIATPEATPELIPMTTYREVMAKLVAAEKFKLSVTTLSSLFAMAVDDDNDIAGNAMSQLGGDMADVEALRLHIMMEGVSGDEAGKALTNSLMVAASVRYEGVSVSTPPGVPEDEMFERPTGGRAGDEQAVVTGDEEAELAALMGGTPPVPAPPIAPAPPAPPQAPSGAPAPVVGPAPSTRRAAPRQPADTTDAIPPEAFALIRGHVKMKDEDLGTMIGVSRQTFINYTKGKPQFVPDATQRTSLVALLDANISALKQARDMIDITE